MPTLQDLTAQRANIWTQMSALMEETGGDLSAEQLATYKASEAEMDRIGDLIDVQQRHADAEKRMNAVDRDGVIPGPRVGGDDEDKNTAYASAFGNWLKAVNGTADLGDEERKTLQAGFVTGDQFKNAAGVGTGAAGGFTVPPAFRAKVQQAMLAWGPMLDLAEKLETDTGVNIPWPTNDDTANEGAILAENTQLSEQDVTLATNSLDAFTYTSKLVRVSWQLMQDNPEFETWLAGRLGERLARIYNRHSTTGTGTSQPDGIVTSAAVGATSTGSFAATGGIAYSNIVDLVESVDDAYLSTMNAGFMVHQSARKQLRKLLDAQNRPLWEPSLQAGQPDSFMGYPVRINNHMAALAASSKSVLFGDIKQAYVIRIVRSNEMVRLTERYADFLQTGFFMFGRFDGTLQQSAAVRVLQTTATA